MSAKHVIKRVKLPLKTCVRLKREARRQRCSVSALVASALRRDLDENGTGALGRSGRVA
jgi:hypothetical protein